MNLLYNSMRKFMQIVNSLSLEKSKFEGLVKSSFIYWETKNFFLFNLNYLNQMQKNQT